MSKSAMLDSRVTPELKAKVDSVSRKMGISDSVFVRIAVISYLEDREKMDIDKMLLESARKAGA